MTSCSPGLSPRGSLFSSIHPPKGECVDTADELWRPGVVFATAYSFGATFKMYFHL